MYTKHNSCMSYGVFTPVTHLVCICLCELFTIFLEDQMVSLYTKKPDPHKRCRLSCRWQILIVGIRLWMKASRLHTNVTNWLKEILKEVRWRPSPSRSWDHIKMVNFICVEIIQYLTSISCKLKTIINIDLRCIWAPYLGHSFNSLHKWIQNLYICTIIHLHPNQLLTC